ncbi:hypothetical protein [Actinokineospora sp. NPDC004072]
MTPLLRLAALYEFGSPTRRVLEYYYFNGLRDAAGGSEIAWEALKDAAFDGLATKSACADIAALIRRLIRVRSPSTCH